MQNHTIVLDSIRKILCVKFYESANFAIIFLISSSDGFPLYHLKELSIYPSFPYVMKTRRIHLPPKLTGINLVICHTCICVLNLNLSFRTVFCTSLNVFGRLGTFMKSSISLSRACEKKELALCRNMILV